MTKTSTIANQSLFDISNQECGSITAVFDLAVMNNLSVTDILFPKTELQTPEAINKDVVRYFVGQNKRIATVTHRLVNTPNYTFPLIFPTP